MFPGFIEMLQISCMSESVHEEQNSYENQNTCSLNNSDSHQREARTIKNLRWIFVKKTDIPLGFVAGHHMVCNVCIVDRSVHVTVLALEVGYEMGK